MSLQSTAKKFRKPKTDISPMFYTRWSPRSMTGEKLTKKELLPLFEAARWAPSAFNVQPWRFVVATGKKKDEFMKFLVEFNQKWCKNAAALVVIISRNNSEYKNKPNPTHSFDTGAAWMSVALEGARRGLVVHGMSGFDYKKVKRALKISNKFTIEAMFAVGKLAPANKLPPEIAKTEKPNQRRKMSEIVSWDGTFGFE